MEKEYGKIKIGLDKEKGKKGIRHRNKSRRQKKRHQ